MDKFFITLTFVFSTLVSLAQTNTLPTKEWTSSAQTPFVLYISGDGGFNSFSNDICSAINTAGYSVGAINAKSYFNDKKTPEQTTNDIVSYLNKEFAGRINQQLVLTGYSFGSDVMPFIVNRLPEIYRKKLLSVVMLSPSTSTDFETHWSDMFGSGSKRNMDVVAEMNKMNAPKVVTMFGDDEDDFPVKEIKIKNYTNVVMSGGHHFDGNTTVVAKTMINYFK